MDLCVFCVFVYREKHKKHFPLSCLKKQFDFGENVKYSCTSEVDLIRGQFFNASLKTQFLVRKLIIFEKIFITKYITNVSV